MRNAAAGTRTDLFTTGSDRARSDKRPQNARTSAVNTIDAGRGQGCCARWIRGCGEATAEASASAVAQESAHRLSGTDNISATG